MRYPFRVLASLLALTTGVTLAAAAPKSGLDSPSPSAAFLLVQGRLPGPDEIGAQDRNLQVDDIGGLYQRLRDKLAKDAASREAVARTAYFDVFGRVVDSAEARADAMDAVTYVEHVRHHLSRLRAQQDAYDDVINRAYRFVVRREAYEEELAYWKKYDTLSYALLVGCIEHWARRNQPGLMVTAGTPTIPFNGEFLTTIQLSPEAASGLRVAAGLGDAIDPYFNKSADARNVLAPGAAQLVAAGGMHFVAVGGEKLASFGPVKAD